MDWYYDGQIRRYVTQFMRIFIGFKYRTGDGVESHIPVMYGDLTRQVASIIKENSENKMPTVPRIACYITGLSLDRNRLADATFVSKLNIRERAYDKDESEVTYKNYQGGNYTVERLMPTPFELTMKADIWTSNTDQKLQIMEQILVLFNPSLEIQTTDNYIDWTSISVVNLDDIGFSSRSIPQGAESDIDICSLQFTIPIYITAPAKVKKLGIIKNIIMNVFTEQGDVADIGTLVYNQNEANAETRVSPDNFKVIMLKSQNGQTYDYDLVIYDVGQTMLSLELEPSARIGNRIDWNAVLAIHGGYTNTSLVHLLQDNDYEITGTFAINPADPTVLVVTVDPDTIPTNTLDSIDAIVNPLTFDPGVPSGDARYLILEDIGGGIRNTVTVGSETNRIFTDINYDKVQRAQITIDGAAVALAVPSASNIGGKYVINLAGFLDSDTKVTYTLDFNESPAESWKNADGSPFVAKANSIVGFSDGVWSVAFDPYDAVVPSYVQNQRTMIQYKWDGVQWLKSFEGEYDVGYWRFDLDA
jgi:hypothetical protein